MAYVPTNWKTGDTITAGKLNKLENAVASGGGGGASGMLITISQSGDNMVLDKNYTEIKNAVESGILPFAIVEDIGICTVCNCGFAEGKYGVVLHSDLANEIMIFLSDTDDGVLTLHTS